MGQIFMRQLCVGQICMGVHEADSQVSSQHSDPSPRGLMAHLTFGLFLSL